MIDCTTAAAEQKPELAPWPMLGCMPCAESPTNATRDPGLSHVGNGYRPTMDRSKIWLSGVSRMAAATSAQQLAIEKSFSLAPDKPSPPLPLFPDRAMALVGLFARRICQNVYPEPQSFSMDIHRIASSSSSSSQPSQLMHRMAFGWCKLGGNLLVSLMAAPLIELSKKDGTVILGEHLSPGGRKDDSIASQHNLGSNERRTHWQSAAALLNLLRQSKIRTGWFGSDPVEAGRPTLVACGSN